MQLIKTKNIVIMILFLIFITYIYRESIFRNSINRYTVATSKSFKSDGTEKEPIVFLIDTKSGATWKYDYSWKPVPFAEQSNNPRIFSYTP